MAKDKKQQKKPSKKTPAPCPLSTKVKVKKEIKKEKKLGIRDNPLIFEKKKRSNIIGVGVRAKKDLSKYVKWPRYIRIQRKKKILLQRLKVPPSINQFNHTLPKSQTQDLLNFLKAYKPESKTDKKQRLLNKAKEALNNNVTKDKKPLFLKYGINHITKLVENKKANLVVIANDVSPIELVLFLPALCRLKEVPYCIVKDKATLGKLVHKKTATAVCLESVKKEDQEKLDYFAKVCKENFNDNVDLRRKWGGQKMSAKSMLLKKMKDKARKIEEAKKKEISAKL
ncbi:putative 60S ribosomal protein L7-3 [Plasmodium gaboni]|uniref:60S ribosomal protein L7a n=1 Tax=Plasmodium gaboni TaxID=647221 RepID=A0A151LA70_9APIC|nr:putative 60S ribosomal protein L7-3 [Plasmodium gaboni]XP_028540589.1 60S ribosomal protein L7-3, putative [Plasmodium sp. gorilla clade G2]SOV24974.1 60S ribosomal protein L7-3, putative [Plasmodium sp. DRC-Itaito]KYN95848.1 putative 60S ribosomal protein L7-3 [Plasmodium gaboni]SOV18933.1 60S ribosomal protein L7-3, putative [Plasmodium gaboni]SOV18990.1 60S ribosomal protein L7-3, putative [Plasmodium sp. gorilla clade G2]